MKPIRTTQRFEASYKAKIARNEQLTEEFWECVEAFLTDRASVDDHALRGKMGLYRAFTIKDDLRVVYFETPEYFLFVNVGKHDEVYYR
jgi:mRNA-degrading endonuclease YafQ of YafQ-DinJ toxin-antitoxin module